MAAGVTGILSRRGCILRIGIAGLQVREPESRRYWPVIVWRAHWVFGVVFMLLGCSTAVLPETTPNPSMPQMDETIARMPDGAALYLRTWGVVEDPALVLLGVHGFNDYGQAFAGLEALATERSPTRIYAYDQRGHGLSGELGRWPGKDRLQADLRSVTRLLRERYPDAYLVVLGESMGGAVVLTALAGAEGLDANAVALLAPAVWGVEAMPWYQRFALWVVRKLAPGASFSSAAARDLGIRPTDDRNVAQALAADPLVQKTARADTLHGLTALMTQAAGQSVPDAAEVLVLYGLRDTVIPPGAVCTWLWLPQMDSAAGMRLAIYPQGYHLLTRQTRSPEVLADLQQWLDELLADREPVMDGSQSLPGRPSSQDSARAAVKGLEYEQSLTEARGAVCALPGVGLRERP